MQVTSSPSPARPSSSRPTSPASATDGVLPRLRRRWLGARDPVDAQLADIARQGAGMARLAHVCAFALIVLFSLGSLVALGGDALTRILRQWAQGQLDVPAAISVTVSTMLVLCMDTGMLYAASMLRVLNARRAEASEKRVHYVVLVVVAILEAATYVDMSARYEAPHTPMVWALILARAAAAPALSIYLSMARPLPVGPRDILYQVELASGKGVIRDVVAVATDASAPLERKVALYAASAIMQPSDRSRLDAMLTVVQGAGDSLPVSGHAETFPEDRPPEPPSGPKPPGRGDRGNSSQPPRREDRTHTPSLAIIPRSQATERTGNGKGSRKAREMARRTMAFALLSETPTLSRSALRKALRCRQLTANALYAEWRYRGQWQQAAQ